MPRRIVVVAIIAAALAAVAFAHAGHIHNILGTVKAASADQLTITTTAGKDATFVLTSKTAYVRDGAAARREDLVTGLRVAVHVGEDGKTATSIKLANQ